VTTPEEIENGRRSLLAQLKQALRRADLEEYPVDVATMRDLIEVLGALPVAPDRLKAAEDVCLLYGWARSRVETEREQACRQAWRLWARMPGVSTEPADHPEWSDQAIADLAEDGI
jgi:hypothetical protein